MSLSFALNLIVTVLVAALAIAFFTLLERNALGYFQTRNGPNKVGLIGLPQPFADALNLFTNEISTPSIANNTPFLIAPIISLFLALFLWPLYPSSAPCSHFSLSVLFFLMVSSLNVYTTLGAGWSSNSNYALLGALRGVAQTISYEVSIVLILLTPLIIISSLSLSIFLNDRSQLPMLLAAPLFFAWFASILAETNRTPFDFAEGESELVSGFNTEYSSGTFALIFIAEYLNILFISLITVFFFLPHTINLPIIAAPILTTFNTIIFAFLFVWVRATLPRIRYDRLIALTWKCYLPIALAVLIPLISITLLINY